MKHPPTVILDRYPNGSVVHVEPECRPLWISLSWIGGAAAFVALAAWSPETCILLSASVLIAFIGAQFLKRAAEHYAEPCSHTLDSAHGLENMADGYAVLRCRCGANRRIVTIVRGKAGMR